jgi:hypothetical protein
MPSALNPFVWDRPVDDPSKIVGMEAFANQVSLILKDQTNVALFGQSACRLVGTARVKAMVCVVEGDGWQDAESTFAAVPEQLE